MEANCVYLKAIKFLPHRRRTSDDGVLHPRRVVSKRVDGLDDGGQPGLAELLSTDVRDIEGVQHRHTHIERATTVADGDWERDLLKSILSSDGVEDLGVEVHIGVDSPAEGTLVDLRHARIADSVVGALLTGEGELDERARNVTDDAVLLVVDVVVDKSVDRSADDGHLVDLHRGHLGGEGDDVPGGLVIVDHLTCLGTHDREVRPRREDAGGVPSDLVEANFGHTGRGGCDFVEGQVDVVLGGTLDDGGECEVCLDGLGDVVLLEEWRASDDHHLRNHDLHLCTRGRVDVSPNELGAQVLRRSDLVIQRAGLGGFREED